MLSRVGQTGHAEDARTQKSSDPQHKKQTAQQKKIVVVVNHKEGSRENQTHKQDVNYGLCFQFPEDRNVKIGSQKTQRMKDPYFFQKIKPVIGKRCCRGPISHNRSIPNLLKDIYVPLSS